MELHLLAAATITFWHELQTKQLNQHARTELPLFVSDLISYDVVVDERVAAEVDVSWLIQKEVRVSVVYDRTTRCRKSGHG